jgi:hypothetical protein
MNIMILCLYLRLIPYNCFVYSLFKCAQQLNFVMHLKCGKKNVYNRISVVLYSKINQSAN